MTDTELEALKALWLNKRERDDYIYFIARDLSKCGRLSGHAEKLSGLASFLSLEQATELYIELRDVSSRLEFEWRAQFVEFFPLCALRLPELQVSEAEFRSAVERGEFKIISPSQRSKVKPPTGS